MTRYVLTQKALQNWIVRVMTKNENTTEGLKTTMSEGPNIAEFLALHKGKLKKL